MKIFTTDRFLFESYHNGLAYSLFNRRACQIIFVQGDDAETLRAEIEALEDQNFNIDQILSLVWEDYSTVALDK